MQSKHHTSGKEGFQVPAMRNLEGGASMLLVGIVAVGAVAITVAIAVGVTTIAVTGALLGAVEEDGHVRELLLLVVALDDLEVLALHQADTDDEDGELGETGDDGGIGNDVDWWTVEEDVVVLLT